MSDIAVMPRSDRAEAPTARKRNSRQRQPDVLTPAEVNALLALPNVKCPTGLRNRCMFELMARSGLRISEVTRLRRRDVKWAEHCIELKRTKGGKSRTVPLLDDTAAWLARWDERRPRAERFFCTLKGGPVNHSYVRQLCKRLGRKAAIDGLSRVHPHAFRHSASVAALDNGLNIREVQTLLGHSKVATTEIYTRVRPRDLVEKFRRRLEPAPEPNGNASTPMAR